MLPIDEKRVLFELLNGPKDFAALSFSTRMATDFLAATLDSLVLRGFLERTGCNYRLAQGVREHLIETLREDMNAKIENAEVVAAIR